MVSFKEDLRLAPPYIGGLRSSEMLCGMGGMVVAEVSGMTSDLFFRGEGHLDA